MNSKKLGASLLTVFLAAAIAVTPATYAKAYKGNLNYYGGGADRIVYKQTYNKSNSSNLTDAQKIEEANEKVRAYSIPSSVSLNVKSYDYLIDGFSLYSLNNANYTLNKDCIYYRGVSDISCTNSNLKLEVTGYYSKYGMTSLDIMGYAKKAGTYTINYNLVYLDDSENVVKEPHTITVYAKNYKPFKKITFAGKSLWQSYSNDNPKYIYYNNNFIAKKKGKLSVKAAKGYTINKIEVGKYESKTISAQEYYDVTTPAEGYSYSGYAIKSKDADDYKVNDNYSYDEYGQYSDYKWTTIGNNKKVTLSNVIEGYSKIDATETKTTTNAITGKVTTSSRNKNANYRKGNTAPTLIRITYTDNKTGETHLWTRTLYKLVKK